MATEEELQPKGASIVKDLLEATGVRHYDAAVVTQLLEFLYRYTSDVLECAQEHSVDGTEISHEDVMLAVQAQDATQFAQPPSQEVLMQLAEKRNSKPLPKFKNRYGLRLPPEEDCLLGINMQLTQQRRQGGGDAPPPSSEVSKGQSSMRKGLHGASRMGIQLQGDTLAPQGDGQASKPPSAPVQQPAVAPPIAAFRGDSPQPQPEGGMPDVDMEEL